MQKGVEVVGRFIEIEGTEEKLPRKIQDLALDLDHRKVLGFWIKALPSTGHLEFLPFNKIEAFTQDAIAISSKNALVPIADLDQLHEVLPLSTHDLRGCQLVTHDGRDLGTVLDLYFSPETGTLEGYEVSGGMFADPKTERAFVPAAPIEEIRDRVAVVPTETVALMEEKELQPPTTAVEIASAAARKAFVIGKIAREAVHTTDGKQLILPGQLITSAHAAVAQNQGVLKHLYCAAGGSSARPEREKKSLACIARPAILRARGRRVRKTLRARGGEIVAAQGEIVTEQTIERARTSHREEALLEAVGLSRDESMEIACVEIAPCARAGAEGATLWETLETSQDKEENLETLTKQEQDIRNILGCPVTRVIRDRDKQVILEIGDLITYQAVERARQAETLDKLLDAAYE